MAKYEEYTQKQQEVLEPLMQKAQLYRRKADELIKKRGENPVMLFDEDQRSRKALNDLEKKYRDTKDEINSILNAKDEMNCYLDKAKHYIQLAEIVKKTWGFE